MGCCEMRDKAPAKDKHTRKNSEDIMNERKEMLHQPHGSLDIESRNLGIPHKDSLSDERALDILQYLQELDCIEGWELVKTEENLSIKKRSGSKYSSEFLVSKLEFLFDYEVPLKLLLDQLNDEKIRPKWDKNFFEFHNIESKGCHEFLLYSAFKVITYKTEYLEKKFLVVDKNKVFIVVYSVDDDRKPLGDVNRAFTFFSVMAVFEDNGKTGMIVYNQTDPKNFLVKMAANVVITKLSDWALKLKRQIEAVYRVE